MSLSLFRLQMCFRSKKNGSNCRKLPGETHTSVLSVQQRWKTMAGGDNNSCQDGKLLPSFTSLEKVGFHQGLNRGSPMRVCCLCERHPPWKLQKAQVENHWSSLCSLSHRSDSDSTLLSSLEPLFYIKAGYPSLTHTNVMVICLEEKGV